MVKIFIFEGSLDTITKMTHRYNQNPIKDLVMISYTKKLETKGAWGIINTQGFLTVTVRGHKNLNFEGFKISLHGPHWRYTGTVSERIWFPFPRKYLHLIFTCGEEMSPVRTRASLSHTSRCRKIKASQWRWPHSRSFYFL